MTETTRVIIAPQYQHLEAAIHETLANFDQFGKILQQERNTIRRGMLEDIDVTIKSFKKPTWIQGIIYGLFRPSKAKRSYEYATNLINKGIGTAKPIAYIEHYNGKALSHSFFISHFIEHDFTIREVLDDKIDDKQAIMESFVSFTATLHNNEVLHLDHSPGNTLIRKTDKEYHFSIIDINRMQFKELDLNERLNNFVRLTDKLEYLELFADTYARIENQDAKYCKQKMKEFMQIRERKVQRKKALKKLVKR